MVKREPTVKESRKKEFRQRIQDMMNRKHRQIIVSELLCTKDSGLKMVRDGALAQGSVEYASLIQKFREMRIKFNNEKHKQN